MRPLPGQDTVLVGMPVVVPSTTMAGLDNRGSPPAVGGRARQFGERARIDEGGRR